jgi:pyrroline-5-carboxylate reductase
MGTAILRGFLDRKSSDAVITKFIATTRTERSAQKLKTGLTKHTGSVVVTTAGDNLKAFQNADIIVLACPVRSAEEILCFPGIRQAMKSKLLISVLAGVLTSTLTSYIHGPPGKSECSVVRALPNIAARIGESMTLVDEDSMQGIPSHHREGTTCILESIGQIAHVAPRQFDVGTALAGCGIAFLCIAFEGLLDGAVSEGMSRNKATELLAQTTLAAAKLMMAGNHPSMLKEEIASPGGLTMKGLLSLERGQVRAEYSDAIIDAMPSTKAM